MSMNEPAISVVVITRDSVESVRGLMSALRKQTAISQMEVVLVGPEGLSCGNEDATFDGFACHQVVRVPQSGSLSQLRAAGVRASRGSVIAFTEEQCFPQPRWAQTFVERHAESWAGVGPVFCNGNPGSALSWANFLIEYGPAAEPLSSGHAPLIAGHNSSYKREVLTQFGDELAGQLNAEPAMQLQLQAKGERFFNDSSAKCVHINVSLFRPSLGLRFHCGRLFAGHRRRDWSIARRLAYTLAWPLIPWVRLQRTWRTTQRIGQTGRFWRILPLLVLLLYFDAFGEAMGYLSDAGDSMQRLADIEIHRELYLRNVDREAYLALQSKP